MPKWQAIGGARCVNELHWIDNSFVCRNTWSIRFVHRERPAKVTIDETKAAHHDS